MLSIAEQTYSSCAVAISSSTSCSSLENRPEEPPPHELQPVDTLRRDGTGSATRWVCDDDVGRQSLPLRRQPPSLFPAPPLGGDATALRVGLSAPRAAGELDCGGPEGCDPLGQLMNESIEAALVPRKPGEAC